MPPGEGRKEGTRVASVKAEAAFIIKTVRRAGLCNKKPARSGGNRGPYFSRSSGVTERCSREARSTACSTTYSALASKR